jgi:UPF0716 protein FxsA
VLTRLILLFTLIPLLELYLLLRIGSILGLGPTVAIVIGTGVLGAVLARIQGLAVLRRVRDDLAGGRLPTVALLDGLLILIAGAVLVTPGLITDLVGLALLIPRFRLFVGRHVARAFQRRFEGPDDRVIDARWRREEP